MKCIGLPFGPEAFKEQVCPSSFSPPPKAEGDGDKVLVFKGTWLQVEPSPSSR